jgi:hypothetical protein
VSSERRHASLGVARLTAQTVVAATILLVLLAVGTSDGDPAELEYQGAVLASPAKEAVLSSSAGVTFSWSLTPGVAAADLAVTEDPGFFGSFVRSGPPAKSQVAVVPLGSQQTSYTFPSSLPKGVALYWAISSVCSECSFGSEPYYSQPFAFGIANPASAHTARSYIRRAIIGLGNAETGVEVRLSTKCAHPSHGAIRCHFTTPSLRGIAVLSIGSGPFTKFDITATQIEGCGIDGLDTCRHNRRWRGTEAQVCSREGLALVPIGNDAGLLCEKADRPFYEP